MFPAIVNANLSDFGCVICKKTAFVFVENHEIRRIGYRCGGKIPYIILFWNYLFSHAPDRM